MKRLHKILMGSGVTLCLGIGITSAIIAAQSKEQLSELTLANIEAMAMPVYGYDNEEDGKVGWCMGIFYACDEPFPGYIIPGTFISRQ